MKIILKNLEGLHELTTKSKSVCNSFQEFQLGATQIAVYQFFQSLFAIRITLSFWRISTAKRKGVLNFSQTLLLFQNFNKFPYRRMLTRH